MQDIKAGSAYVETTLQNSKLNVHKLAVRDTGCNEEDRAGGYSDTIQPNSVVKGSYLENAF